MGFGGAVSAMISSIKNNSRGKRKTYFDSDLKASKKEKITFKNTATQEDLDKIRTTILREQKQKNIKVIVLCIVIVPIILFVFKIILDILLNKVPLY